MKKRQAIKTDALNLFNHYREKKKKIAWHIFYSSFLMFIALVFLGGKLLYPYHFMMGLFFFCLSLFTFGRLLLSYRNDKIELNTYKIGKLYVGRYKAHLILLVVFMIIMYIVSVLIPFRGNPFESMSDEEISATINRDLSRAVIVIDKLDLISDELFSADILDKRYLTSDERSYLIALWNDLLAVLAEEIQLADKHRYFNSLSVDIYSDEKAESFIIAYSLYAKKYEIIHEMITRVNGNDYIKKILNEYNQTYGRKEVYREMSSYFYDTETIAKLNAGNLYLKLLGLKDSNWELNENYYLLKNEAKSSYAYLFSQFKAIVVNSKDVGVDAIEGGAEGVWFPIQKKVADKMGRTYLSDRDEKFITPEQINEVKKELLPGDIMVERRNWYMGNIGIPGFWPHSALYTGTLAEMDGYFQEIFPLDGYTSAGEYIKAEHYKVYNDYLKKFKDGNRHAVIEGKAPGMILQSLEESLRADYAAAMRPRLSKIDKFKAIARAYTNYGKPYDYNFDFATRDELVCSELIYDAYQTDSTKKGLDFQPVMVTGRLLLSPTDIVKKFFEDYGTNKQQLDFVFFFDGSEQEGRAIRKDVEAFLRTWNRPKYDFFQE